jgi:hypothetical protein
MLGWEGLLWNLSTIYKTLSPSITHHNPNADIDSEQVKRFDERKIV